MCIGVDDYNESINNNFQIINVTRGLRHLIMCECDLTGVRWLKKIRDKYEKNRVEIDRFAKKAHQFWWKNDFLQEIFHIESKS